MRWHMPEGPLWLSAIPSLIKTGRPPIYPPTCHVSVVPVSILRRQAGKRISNKLVDAGAGRIPTQQRGGCGVGPPHRWAAVCPAGLSEGFDEAGGQRLHVAAQAPGDLRQQQQRGGGKGGKRRGR